MNAATCLTVTSPRTGITYTVRAYYSGSIYTGAFELSVIINRPGKSDMKCKAIVDVDGSVTLAHRPWWDIILPNGHLDSAEGNDKVCAEVLANVRYMWAKMEQGVKAWRAGELATKAAEALARGDEEKAEKMRAALGLVA